MRAWSFSQVALLGVEAMVLSGLLLFLFRLRSRLGLSPLYIALGAFQQMQALLALSIYVEIAPGILISPGSAVLFTAGLFAVLLVYIREDATEARKLIYGLIVANLALTVLSFFFSLHLDDAATRNLYNLPRELFLQPRITIVGTAVLLLDAVLIVILYEAVSRYVTRFLFLRIFLSMTLVLTVDTLLFVTGSFAGEPNFRSILVSGLLGKSIMSLLYSGVLTAYLQLFERAEFAPPRRPPAIRDIFELLTYRQKYEVLQEEAVRDPLTGLRSRGFFDDNLPLELERATRLGQPITLLMIDVDHFKIINDKFGHPEGDRVLKVVAASLTDSVRSADLACRYGGEEFALILSNTNGSQALVLANHIRDRLHERSKAECPALLPDFLTVTIGVACFPSEESSASPLIRLADRRLYEGKRAGRNCVVYK